MLKYNNNANIYYKQLSIHPVPQNIPDIFNSNLKTNIIRFR